jgi:hypothetical protein
MPTLVSTPGASDANSYASLAFAADYFATRLGSDTWINSEDESRIPALIHATRVLDSVYDWIGWQTTSTQSLRWPREGAENPDQYYGSSAYNDLNSPLTVYWPNDIIPPPIMDATCEMALSLMSGGGYAASVNNLSSVRVGPITVVYNTDALTQGIPTTVTELLRGFGSYSGTSGGNTMGVVRTVRV